MVAAPQGYGLDVAKLDKPDVLMNHNHPKPDADGKVKELWSFRRSNYFEHVGHEIKNVTNNVGLLDMSAFAKIEVSGPGARAWLELRSWLIASPKKQGRIALCRHLDATWWGSFRIHSL